MARQTLQPKQWLVLDDGPEPTKCTMGQEYYYLPHCRGKGSMVKKLQIVFQMGMIKADWCAIIEDDDFYAPSWLKWCADGLRHHDIVGEGCALYYNVRRRWWFCHQNMQHASLCSTAFNKNAYHTVLKQSANHDPFIDVRIWRGYSGPKRCVANKPRLVVGIKAMPGIGGYGTGHGEAGNGCMKNPDMSKLKQEIGDDALVYEKFYQP